MAAGLGYKEFATGDVLTAADANGYLASQVVMVFASATARTSAIASPQEGMISYLKDTNSTEYYSGSAWVAIGGSSSANPLFRAYRSTTQTPTNATYVKIQFNTESFDTNSCYDPTTNYRFTPNVAGYYLATIRLGWTTEASTGYCAFYKNGTNVSIGGRGTGFVQSQDFFYMNGTTDYLEAYVYTESNASIGGNSDGSFFGACWVRS